jgi:voltage-gated potassium channel
MLVRGGTPNHLHLRQRLSWLVACTLAVDGISSAIAYALEKDAPRSQLHSYGQSLFWTTTQLLTVSSQLVNPVTGAGMWLDVFMELFGITVVSALAGSLGSFLYRRSMERNPHPWHPGQEPAPTPGSSSRPTPGPTPPA